MAWVAVDYDGTEWISENEPKEIVQVILSLLSFGLSIQIRFHFLKVQLRSSSEENYLGAMSLLN